MRIIAAVLLCLLLAQVSAATPAPVAASSGDEDAGN
jgi:hypothetical protein